MPDETPDAAVPETPDAPVSTFDPNDAEVQKFLREAVAEATKPLIAKRDELLGKTKKANEEYRNLIESLGGEESIESLRELRAKEQDGELQKLLETGKLDQYRRSIEERAAKPFQAKLSELEKRAAELEEGRNAEVERRRAVQRNIDLTSAALKAGVEEKYVEKIVRLTEDLFSRDDELDSTVGTDGVLKPLDFYESDAVREEYSVFFKGSQGAGAAGGGAGPRNVQKSKMNFAEKAAFIEKYGQDAYSKLAA